MNGLWGLRFAQREIYFAYILSAWCFHSKHLMVVLQPRWLSRVKVSKRRKYVYKWTGRGRLSHKRGCLIACILKQTPSVGVESRQGAGEHYKQSLRLAKNAPVYIHAANLNVYLTLWDGAQLWHRGLWMASIQKQTWGAGTLSLYYMLICNS